MGIKRLVVDLLVDVLNRHSESQKRIAYIAVEKFIRSGKAAGAVFGGIEAQRCPGNDNHVHITASTLFKVSNGPYADADLIGDNYRTIVVEALGAVISLTAAGLDAEFRLRYSTPEEEALLEKALADVAKVQGGTATKDAILNAGTGEVRDFASKFPSAANVN